MADISGIVARLVENDTMLDELTLHSLQLGTAHASSLGTQLSRETLHLPCRLTSAHIGPGSSLWHASWDQPGRGPLALTPGRGLGTQARRYLRTRCLPR